MKQTTNATNDHPLAVVTAMIDVEMELLKVNMRSSSTSLSDGEAIDSVFELERYGNKCKIEALTRLKNNIGILTEALEKAKEDAQNRNALLDKLATTPPATPESTAKQAAKPKSKA